MKMMSLNHIRRMSTLSSRALVGLETRWVKLPECEQGAIADTLAVAQKGDWKKMTLEQKRAGMCCILGVGVERSDTRRAISCLGVPSERVIILS